MIVSFGFNGGEPKRVQKIFDVRDLTHNESDPAFLDKYREITEYVRAHPGENIAIGCEHGKHRSRVLANKVATAARTSVFHRDIKP